MSLLTEAILTLHEGDLAAWLKAWVASHSGIDYQDLDGRLHVVCRCGHSLGVSYGPRSNDPKADEHEALAYFEQQAQDLIAWAARGGAL